MEVASTYVLMLLSLSTTHDVEKLSGKRRQKQILFHV